MARQRTTRRTTKPTPADWLDRVRALAQNLWWTWNPSAQQLFAALDPQLWEATHRNPVATLNRLSPDRAAQLGEDANFQAHVRDCEKQLNHYLQTRTWFDRTASRSEKRMQVAYFCAEYGLHECLPLYAGGLGVLAGDHLKSASDLGVPLVAIGLLYRCGYYEQSLDSAGRTRVRYHAYAFRELPLTDTGRTVSVPFGRRTVVARIWEALIGRVPLYLLDTDLAENKPADRRITRHLYGGDSEMRIQQELLLGVGGLRALEVLKIFPTVYHLNEGHAAFCGVERLRQLHAAGADREAAMEQVRRTTVFTTHTPVPAGHDRFDPKLVMKYFSSFARDIGRNRRAFLALGREEPGNAQEPFCMTVLALRLSANCNGVAQIHGGVSREMWRGVFGVEQADDVPISHVTNGIHPQTWLAPEAEPLYRRYLKPRWIGAGPHDDWWAQAERIPNEDLWRLRCLLRARLVHFIRTRLKHQIQQRLGPLDDLLAVYETFDETALTIGFARRFATYKRAPLIFTDAKRLAKILGDRKRPVQLVFAGKAHPKDEPGQEYARRIYQFAHRAGFRGKVALLENYDMEIGRMLTSGCDVWLNNPLRPQEASGTSGMKPPLHGGLNLSILDGWWPEAYDGRNGWAIGDGNGKRRGGSIDRRDAAALYDLLESEVVRLFYRRDRDGIPQEWLQRGKHSMATVCGPFSALRMLGDYVRDYYLPAHG